MLQPSNNIDVDRKGRMQAQNVLSAMFVVKRKLGVLYGGNNIITACRGVNVVLLNPPVTVRCLQWWKDATLSAICIMLH